MNLNLRYKNTVSTRIEELLANKLSKYEVFLALKDHEPDHKKLTELIFDFPVVKDEKDKIVFRINYFLFLFFLSVSCLAFMFALKGLLLKILMIGIWGIWYELSKNLLRGMNSGFNSSILISGSIIVMFLLMIKFYKIEYFNSFYYFVSLVTFFGTIFLINLILGFKYHGLKIFKSGWDKKRNAPNF